MTRDGTGTETKSNTMKTPTTFNIRFPKGARQITGSRSIVEAMPRLRALCRDLATHAAADAGITLDADELESRALQLLATYREQGFDPQAVENLRWIYASLPRRKPRSPKNIACLPAHPQVLTKTRWQELETRQRNAQKLRRRTEAGTADTDTAPKSYEDAHRGTH